MKKSIFALFAISMTMFADGESRILIAMFRRKMVNLKR